MEILGDTEKKVAMCEIDEVGKRPTPMGLEKQVGQGFENRANVVIGKVENDEFTNVDNDVQFLVPPVEAGFLKNRHSRSKLESALQTRHCIRQSV